MHGGTNPGAPRGNRNAWKHGYYSAEAVQRRQLLAQFCKATRADLRAIREATGQRQEVA